MRQKIPNKKITNKIKVMFYKINTKNGVVEYSTDKTFFIENQIWVSNSGGKYHFNSKLEAKNFRIVKNVLGDRTLTHDNILSHCHSIHEEILRGIHGIGELVK